MKQNTQPVVKIVNGVYTFKNLNPNKARFGLKEDDYYQLCLLLCDLVGWYQHKGNFMRDLLENLKQDGGILFGMEAVSEASDVLFWSGCFVKDDLRELKKFLPNKADRRVVLLGGLLDFDGFFRMDVEEDHYSGKYFDFDDQHNFSWTLQVDKFFEFVYDYERAHSI